MHRIKNSCIDSSRKLKPRNIIAYIWDLIQAIPYTFCESHCYGQQTTLRYFTIWPNLDYAAKNFLELVRLKKMSGMGITVRTTLLVYQWDDMRGKRAKRLGREDEDMSKMQGF